LYFLLTVSPEDCDKQQQQQQQQQQQEQCHRIPR
jgi:hypothetical protein